MRKCFLSLLMILIFLSTYPVSDTRNSTTRIFLPPFGPPTEYVYTSTESWVHSLVFYAPLGVRPFISVSSNSPIVEVYTHKVDSIGEEVCSDPCSSRVMWRLSIEYHPKGLVGEAIITASIHGNPSGRSSFKVIVENDPPPPTEVIPIEPAAERVIILSAFLFNISCPPSWIRTKDPRGISSVL